MHGKIERCLSFWRSVQLLRERAITGRGGGGSGEGCLVKILERHPAIFIYFFV